MAEQINEQVQNITDNLAQPVAAPVYATPSVVSVPAPQPSQVYSAANIAQAATSPVARPDLSDPFGVRDFYMNSPEIQAARAEAQRIQEAINASRQGLRTTTTALQNQNEQAMGGTGASINLIGRQVGRARELTSNELAALSENQLAAQSYLDTLLQEGQAKYAIAEQQRAQIQELIAQTGGKAGISYADTFETAIKKATKYQEEQAKEAEKKAYKDSLKAQLQALGKNTRGLSTKELEKKLRKAFKSKQAYEEEIKQLELAAKRKALSGGSGTAGERLGSIGATAQTALLSSRGSDGKVDPGVYTSQRASYMRAGGTSSDFDAQFGGLLSANEQRNLGVQLSGSTSKSGLTPAQKTQIADFDSTIQSARDAASLAKNVNTGFISGRVGKIGQSLGFASENFVNLNAKLSQVKSNFMKALAGANVTESERKRLEAFLPDVNDSEKTIQTKLSNFVTELERQRDNLQIQGGGTGQIRVIRKSDGAEGYIPANEFDPSEYTMI